MSIQPVRLQLSRRPGFRLQTASLALNGLPAINCARPSRRGNRWRGQDALRRYRQSWRGRRACAAAIATLCGHNLACWCELDEPCHCDIALPIVNSPITIGNRFTIVREGYEALGQVFTCVDVERVKLRRPGVTLDLGVLISFEARDFRCRRIVHAVPVEWARLAEKPEDREQRTEVNP